MVHQVEAIVGTISLLLDDSNILAEGLLCVFQLRLQPFDVLFVHHLLIRLFECHFASQVLHFTVRFRFYTRDLFLLASPPDFIKIT